ncbi:CBO0543 family protein [Paludifilum halophilum]|uniref:Uncharacterized protein n=1 Tax=Paludifilum halophilum TaxID=1642702 RepID=A0A235BC79_9BACL|nr:CBO0543 family protein [Paludifilum halophilum]OYD09547.1 hypothetical protein CHM34_00575 [Paludifilum halophilum]
MVFIFWLIIWWLIGLLLIHWKEWRRGYSTALAASLGSFLLDAAFVSGGFWGYEDPLLPGLWPHITLNLGIYPIGAWIYIQRYPDRILHQVRWILLGTVILLAVELNLHQLGRMYYEHGWNMGLSALANVLLLILLRLHDRWVEGRKPPLNTTDRNL